jgi:hypothetical protein
MLGNRTLHAADIIISKANRAKALSKPTTVFAG